MRFQLLSRLIPAALAAITAAPAALAGVIVSVIPDSQTVNIDEVFTVDIVASMSEPVLGWAMVFTIQDPAIVSVNGTPSAAAPWFDTTEALGGDWLLGGLAFPDPISGPDILLATISMTATAYGETDLLLTIDPQSLRQGFALGPPWPTGTFDFVLIDNGHVMVIPAPGALALLTLACGWQRRRRAHLT